MNSIACPECAGEFAVETTTEVNEIVVCSDCGVDLEITALNPFAVDLAPMEEEDWGE